MNAGQILNLRLARKRRMRAAKEAQAESNRAKSSVPGTIRRTAKAQTLRRDAVLAGHELDPTKKSGK